MEKSHLTQFIAARSVKCRRPILFAILVIVFIFYSSRYLGKKSKNIILEPSILEAVVDVLATLESSKEDVFVADLDWIRNYNKTTSSKVTFGLKVKRERFSSLIKNLRSRLGTQFAIIRLRCKDFGNIGGFIVTTATTNEDVKLYFLNFELIGDYMFVCGMNLPQERYFGDVERTIDTFDLEEVKTKLGTVNIPANIDEFIRDYKVSKYLGCNITRQRELFAIYPEQKHDLDRVNRRILPGLVAMKKTMKYLRKNFFLAGGTLLGWYRQCGIIEQSKDVDFAMMDLDYDESVPNAFLGGVDIRVTTKFGHRSLQGTELRLYNGKYTFDLFTLFKNPNNDTLHCIYQVKNSRYIRSLSPIRELCSCDLLGIRLLVTCDPLSYIENEYGPYPRWFHPRNRSIWTNLKFEQKFNSTFTECYYTERYDVKGNKRIHKFLDKDTNRTIDCNKY